MEVLTIKDLSYSRRVLKITTEELEKSGWSLTVELAEAKKNGWTISLSESTCIRMIEDIAGVDRETVAVRLQALKHEMKELRRQKKSVEQVRRIKQIFQEQDEIQFLPEYLCVVSKTKEAFRTACRGFSVNGLRYTRLVGTPGGVKNNTVVFVSETSRNGRPLAEELRRRIDNGRNMTKEFVPAKLEAYRALVCSASAPLSAPHGVLVVPDCTIKFNDSYILVKDGEKNEPIVSEVEDGEVEVTDSDGYGLMSPGLAQRWGNDLRLDYRPAGICLRNSFCKGMVFAFDFHEFAETVAGNYEVKDIWGAAHDIRDIDLVLTASMLKLWDSYGSVDEYLTNCEVNGHCFAATKATPKELDVERRTNYQFLQGHRLSDDDIWELIEPTVTELTDAINDDYAKALLFLRGTQLNEENAWSTDQPWVEALMAEPEMMNDPYVRERLQDVVKKKKGEAHFGKLKVHGNFSIISGDPFALCQSMWGLPVKGILKAGEVYNRYWADVGAGEVAGYRAPMLNQHNIARLAVRDDEISTHWYQYMDTVTVLNAWDMTRDRWCGADADGDQAFLTDDPVLLRTVPNVLPIKCEQKKAATRVPTEADFIVANERSFGDKIGEVTNRITAMIEIQALFDEGSPEYEELGYRIRAGVHQQQAAVDRTKGIVSKPMPRAWYSKRAAEKTGNPVDAKICAHKKPYFVVYRYEQVKIQYNKVRRAVEELFLIKFGMEWDGTDVPDLLDEEKRKLYQMYEQESPIKRTNGVVNRICRRCEEHFAENKRKNRGTPTFDRAILKSEVNYTTYMYKQIEALCKEYEKRLKEIEGEHPDCSNPYRASRRRDDNCEEYIQKLLGLQEYFDEACATVCPNEDILCNIVVDLCYKTEKTKRFAWHMCGQTMVKNLLRRTGGRINYPCLDEHGEVSFKGRRFKMKQAEVAFDGK